MGKGTAIRQPFNPSGVHSFLVVDIVGYGNRMGHMQKHVRKSLYDVLGAALRAAGVALSDCYVEDRGDGAVVVTREVVTQRLVGSFVVELDANLRQYNKTASEEARIRLRVVVHEGRVEWDGHGLVGPELNLAFRLLNADQVKALLRDSDAAMVYVVSKHVFDTVIQHDPQMIDPDDFTSVEIRNKETVTRCWILLRGGTRPAPTSTPKQWSRKTTIRVAAALVLLLAIVLVVRNLTDGGNGEPDATAGQRISIDQPMNGIVPRCAMMSGSMTKKVENGRIVFALRAANGNSWFLMWAIAHNESRRWSARAWFGGSTGHEGVDFEIVAFYLAEDAIQRLPSMKMPDLPDEARYSSETMIVTRDNIPSPGVCERFLSPVTPNELTTTGQATAGRTGTG